MQIKFITLTLSAVLAISALSANALPTSKRDATGQDVTTQTENKSVAPGASTSNPSQKSVGLSNLSGDLTTLVSDLLDVVKGLLEKVVDPLLTDILELVERILTGEGDKEGLIEELLEAVKKLLDGDKPGRFNNGASAQEPATRNSGNEGILDMVVCLVRNLLGGHSAEESGVENIIALLENLLDSLLGNGDGAGAGRSSHGADKYT
ncbi:hypothetical protein INT45_012449 [Circinella minor]|uniref:Uncharacterized protein n=1 Tax=Circinella minor TaxID=1195481 RepID=A0A8H7RVW2_9FUNG|nr:hypothetical protein INT45_012449 [Circinella minor]